MSIYWKRSRITKVLADAARVGSFSEAEARLVLRSRKERRPRRSRDFGTSRYSSPKVRSAK